MKALLSFLLVTIVTFPHLFAQTITIVNPDTGILGQSISVSIYGQNTTFVQGTTPSVWLNNGPSTITLASINTINDSLLTGILSIPSNADTGNWGVYINTPLMGTIAKVNGFYLSPNPLILTTSLTNITCAFSCNGTATVSASGCAPYTYLWNDPLSQTTATATGLCAGAYAVMVNGNSGCPAVQSVITITQPPPITSVISTTPTTCGASDGTASVTVTGGTPPYAYLWGSGDTTASISGQSAGLLTLAVTDSNSCAYVDSSTSIVDSCGNISGHVFNDINGDGVQNPGENGIAGLMVRLTPGPIVGYTDQNGNYSINLSNFTTYTVTASLPSVQYFCSGSMILSSSVSLPPPPGTYSILIDNANPVSAGNDFGIAPPAVPCGTISGHVWEDLNQNGAEDVGGGGMPGANIMLDNGAQAQTDGNGDYNIDVLVNATYQVQMITGGGNFNYYCYGNQVTTSSQTFPTSPVDYTITPTSGTPNISGLDFGMATIPIVDAGMYSLWPYGGVIPGNDFAGGMDFKIYDASSTSCTLRLDFDPLVTFVSASITPDVITSTYVEWIFVNPSNYFGMCMYFTFNLSSSAPPGEELNWFASISCDAIDGCPQNDTRSATTYVANPNKSWKIDLNKIMGFHTGDSITGDITTADSTFSYEIGYMNLGTDTIYNMTIRDTLPDHFDINSISKPFSMHESILDMDIVDSNVLVFTFNGINLTDTATYYATSYGFVQFNVRLKRNLPVGTVIENSAAIYFDYDDPIFTDTTSNTIVQSTSIPDLPNQRSLITVHPNPLSTSTTFQIKGASSLGDMTLQLYDILGKKVKELRNIRSPRFELSREGLLNGIYFYQLSGKQEVIGSGKLIVN